VHGGRVSEHVPVWHLDFGCHVREIKAGNQFSWFSVSASIHLAYRTCGLATVVQSGRACDTGTRSSSARAVLFASSIAVTCNPQHSEVNHQAKVAGWQAALAISQHAAARLILVVVMHQCVTKGASWSSLDGSRGCPQFFDGANAEDHA